MGKSAQRMAMIGAGTSGHKYRRIKSSSLRSIERGWKTEIDYLNG